LRVAATTPCASKQRTAGKPSFGNLRIPRYLRSVFFLVVADTRKRGPYKTRVPVTHPFDKINIRAVAYRRRAAQFLRMTWLQSARNKAFFQLPSSDYFTSIAAGLIAGYTRLHPEWAPAQIPALALFAWSLAKTTGIVGRLRPGFWFGASMAALVLGNVGVPIPAAGILFIAMTVYWMTLGAGLSHLLQRGGIAGVLGAAGLLTLGEWAQTITLPMFGTAQRLANAWVEYDAALISSRFGGTLLVTFLLGALSFGIATRIQRKTADCRRGDGKNQSIQSAPKKDATAGFFGTPPIIGMLTGAFLLIYFFNMLNLLYGGWDVRIRDQDFTVAVCGSKSAGGAFMDPDDFLKKYRPMLAEAAAKGAKLVVTPEMGLFVKDAERDATLTRFAQEARELGVAWVVGYAQSGPSLNRAVLLNADTHGQDARATKAPATKEGHAPIGESYDKTHWVPFIEHYDRHGDARAITGRVAGVKVGLMICQDDNYEVVARNLSLAGVQVAAVPTFDWPGVEHAHLNSARNRPREFGFVEARAAIGGVSAVIDTTGNIVAKRNHLTEGDGMTLTRVAIGGGGPTPFARFGNLPILATSALLVANALRRRKTSPEVSAAARV
jgi:predicted amidohydrolase